MSLTDKFRVSKTTKRIRSLNDLFYALVFLVSLPFNLLITYYAHGMVTGFQDDTSSIKTSVSLLIQIPNVILQTVISPIIPLCVILILLLRRRFIDVLAYGIALICSFGALILVQLLITALNDPILLVGYRTNSVSVLPNIPIYLIFVVAILYICGKNEHETRKYVQYLIWTTLITSTILLILGVFSLMSGVLAFQIGAFIGYILRYAFGQINLRLTVKDVVKMAHQHGYKLTDCKEMKGWDTLRCRYLSGQISQVANNSITENIAPRPVFIQIYDYDRGVLNLLQRLIQFIKFKDMRMKSASSINEYEHKALMSYMLKNAGLNQLSIITSSQIKGSSVFVFDGSLPLRHINPEVPLDYTNVMQFWNELNKAHTFGITFTALDYGDLVLLNNAPSIFNASNAQHNSASLFRYLNYSSMLAALSCYQTPDLVVQSFIQFASNNIPPKHRNILITEVLAGLNSFNIPIATRNALNKKYPNTDIIEQLKDLITDTTAENDSFVSNNNAENTIPTDFRRISLGKVVTIGLTIFAVTALLTQLDWNSLTDAVAKSNILIAFIALAASFITFLGGSIALKGFSHRMPVKIRDAFVVQIAASWASVQLPAALGPITMNLRYLNRINSGNRKTVAENSAIVSVVQTAQAIISFAMLLLMGTLTGSHVGDAFEGTPILIAVTALVIFGALMAILPVTRNYFQRKIMPMVTGFIGSLRTVFRRPKYVILGVCGCIIQEIGYGLALYFSLLAFGINISFFTVMFVFLVANVAGSSVPTPGGLGVYEGALTLALGVVGIPASVALSATLLYRIITFWLRAPLGFIIEKVLIKQKIIL